MPWICCGARRQDDEATCPVCGKRKQSWTVRLGGVRNISVARPWIDLELTEADGRPMPGEPYRVVAPDGVVHEGTLDERGQARIKPLPRGTCQVSFPRREVTAVDLLPPRPLTVRRTRPPSFPATPAPYDPADAPPEAPLFDWLELEATDGQGAPLAGERYRVEDEDGQAHEGTLDAQGRARFAELPTGTCKVTFPDRHAADVSLVQPAAAPGA